jgi:uncharacterized protein (TIGR02145 family)
MKSSLRIPILILSGFLIFSCKKGALIPIVTTQDVFDITYRSATSGGNVTDDGGAPVVERGLCWNTSGSPTIEDDFAKGGMGTGPFRKSITTLLPGTAYYLRSYATNSAGTGYGNEMRFTTVPIEVPVLITYPITFTSQTSINTGGSVTKENGSHATARGVCWDTSPNPTVNLSTITSDGTLNGNFYSKVTGLIPGTTYYLRAYATNDAGTGYGNEFKFTIHIAGTAVTDIDENVYNTVTIGTQIWMVENLKTTRFNDNTPINLVTNGYWQSNYPVYCWYNNNENKYNSSYGALYNWSAVNTYTGKNVCPTGWHVPTDKEWTTLTTYLGGESIAGGKMKETGTTHWLGPNNEATNESGFSALPGGTTNFNSGFNFLGLTGGWWSSDNGIYNMGYYPLVRTIYSYYGYVERTIGDQRFGYSVRCMRDY